MKYEECVTNSELLNYYEGLIDFLYEYLPNLEDLIAVYEENE